MVNACTEDLQVYPGNACSQSDRRRGFEYLDWLDLGQGQPM